ncbi:MAG: hypothetical protein DWB42_03800 [Chloroflexi bacterium]|nr:hypothetical protein [Chloroflexota bacterium]MDL1882102.1 hypothetical protein [Anaerolineae bacterium CFX8]
MRQLTIERAAAIILFALLFALAARIPTDTDTWWHIRCGEYTLSNGMIYADPFSFTKAGEPWINHSWGAQIVLYGVWQAAGNLGLAVYTAALATGGMWFVYKMSPGSVYLRAFVLVIGAAAAAVFWSPRPQMLSFFLSVAVLYLLHLYKRRGIDRLWLLPVMVGLWGNLHAGFSIAFIFLGGFIAGEVLNNLFRPTAEHVIPWRGIRRLVLVTAVSAAALVVNPYGLHMLAVPFQTISIGALQNFIQEWNSPNFHDRSTWPFIFLLLGLLGAAGGSRKRLDWTDFLLASGTAFMGLLAGRNIAVFAVAATPVLADHLDALLSERGWVIQPARRVTPRMGVLNAALAALIVLGAAAKVLLVLDADTVREAQETYLPVKVAEYLRDEDPAGPMFNSYNWGGYLMFMLPDEPVFVDGRTDLYGDEFLTNTYLRTATGGDGWRETLNRYGIRLVVVEAGSGLARQLRVEPGWSLDYEDAMAAVFTREIMNG